MGRSGRVVVLNGTASAGKSTLARTIQQTAPGMWVLFSQDDFAQSLLPRWVKVDGAYDGGHGTEGFHFVRDGFGLLHVEAGEVGRRLLRGYRFAAAACAKVGNDVVVDECMFDASGWDEWREALVGVEVTWVRVECDLDVCEQREALRTDRRQLIGLARGQYDPAHADVRYDLTVDLTHGDVEGAARFVLAALARPTWNERAD